MKTFLPSFVFSVFLLLPLGALPASAQSISIVSGNGQLICSLCPTRPFTFEPLVVRVKDARGNPQANVTVTWTVNNPPGVDGRLLSATTVTGPDGTTSNMLSMSAPIMLLQTFLQTRVTASALGSSVAFTETNTAVAQSTGLSLVLSNLESPFPGTQFSGAAGSVSSTPIKINVASLSGGGVVQGIEIRAVSDPTLPATATCTGGNSVLTDTQGNAVCTLQFGSTEGQGKVRIYVGGSYDIYGPFTLQVTGTGGNPGTPGTPGPPTGATLTANPSTLSFQYPGAVSQNVAVVASSGSVAYTAAVQVTLARVDWLSVGTPTGPATPNGSSTFTVNVSPQSLANGTYSATIVLHPTGGGQDTNVNVQLVVGPSSGPTVPVNPTVSVTPSPTLLTFQYPGQVTQNVAVIANGGNVNYTPAVQVTIARVDWLTVGQPTGPAFGDARSTFPVTVNPQSLAPGTYRGTITIHPAGGAQDALVNVELVVSPSTVSVAPGALRLSQVAGRAPFSGGTISVASTGGSVPFTASVSSANWLTVSPSTGFTPAQIAVSVNGSGLAAGNYTGEIIVSTPGASNPLQSVTVVLSVEPAQSLRLSTSTLNFTSEAGTVAPAPQTIGATASDGTLLFSAVGIATSPPGGSWLQVSPSGGAASSTAANVTVSVNPTGLEPGTYTGIVSLTSPNATNSPQSVSVTYVVVPIATPVPTLIANAASGLPGAVAPGEILTIFGRNLGPNTGLQAAVTDGFVQTQLSETQVTFDNLVAPLLYVSATQINVIAPYGIAGRVSTRMVVSYKRSQSTAITLSVVDAAPSIFVLDPSGQGAIVNEDGSVNGSGSPAQKGRVVVIYATGEGATTPSGADGRIVPADVTQLKHPVLPVTVTIGGRRAEVQYAGSAPGLVSGAMQINVVVPEDAPSGSAVPVNIAVGSFESQGTVMMAID